MQINNKQIALGISIFISILLMGYFSTNILHGFPLRPDIPSTKYPEVGEIWVALQHKKIDWMEIGEVYGTKKVGQSFIAERNGLDRIDVLPATFGDRKNTEDYIFHLTTNPHGESDLRTVVFNAKSVSDSTYVNIVFPEIPDSQNKTYYLFIESPNSKPGNALTFYFVSNSASYPKGKLFINNKPIDSNLVFRPYYKTTFVEFVKEFLNRITVFQSTFISSEVLIILFILLLATIIFISILLSSIKIAQT